MRDRETYEPVARDVSVEESPVAAKPRRTTIRPTSRQAVVVVTTKRWPDEHADALGLVGDPAASCAQMRPQIVDGLFAAGERAVGAGRDRQLGELLEDGEVAGEIVALDQDTAVATTGDIRQPDQARWRLRA